MQTKFRYQPELESQRLLSVYLSIARDIYSKNGFLVLPYRVAGHPKTIYLPDMKELLVKDIIHKISHYDRVNVPTDDLGLLEISAEIQKYLADNEGIEKAHTQAVEQMWEFQEKIFEDYLLTIFPRFRGKKLKLNIYWTRYGSLVSYSRPTSQGVETEATIFLRDDMGVGQIVEGALSSLLSIEFDNRKMSWMQRESIVDFFGLDTCFKHLAVGFHPTLFYKKQNDEFNEAKLLSDSILYIQRMGLDRPEQIKIKNNMVYVYGKLSASQFGRIELKFLEILINRPMTPISYYDMGDLLWSEDPDSFSLWALSQLAYKVRNKLRKDGITTDIIRNARGVGYIYVPQN